MNTMLNSLKSLTTTATSPSMKEADITSECSLSQPHTAPTGMGFPAALSLLSKTVVQRTVSHPLPSYEPLPQQCEESKRRISYDLDGYREVSLDAAEADAGQVMFRVS